MSLDIVVWPGRPFPLGASWDGQGTNFAVWSSSATGVTVCLFGGDGRETRVPLTDATFGIWHGYLPGVHPGQLYGLRVDGPYEPARGQLHNRTKLLVDPYAKAIVGDFSDHPAVYAATRDDSAPYVPRCAIIDPAFDWGDDRHPNVPWDDTVIYELHVRGFTRQHPDVPGELRGTYAGLAHPAVIDYLRSLGVTAVELMPVHQFVSEPFVQARGMRNYWGYNTLGFFAPHAAYAQASDPGGVVREFKSMVRALHAAGIEVLLDVVYNHTCEGGPGGPVLSFRGIDNRTYYRLQPGDPSQYADYTGCGNTFDARLPFSLRLIMDSLRYWVTEMHVDGFRFDLASALARSLHDVDRLSAFFDTIHQDPVVSQVKLIAEPWDVGDGGYQVGNFPPLWTEWNGVYRDTVRAFWARGSGGVRDLAYRLSGSSDLYGDAGRLPFASINFVTAHDGFTLRDLVSYERKRNEANGEDNRDGTDDNRSYNCGVEGPTDDPMINELRLRQARNLLVTLLLSTGVPMLLAGDERWRTQNGNNNAYVQDNPTSWLSWAPSPEADDLLALTRRVIALRRASPVLRQRAFFEGRPLEGGSKDLAWFHLSGRELTDADWFDSGLRTIGMYLDGRGLRSRGVHGEPIVDESYLLVLHSGDDIVSFTLPGEPWAESYEILIDTTSPTGASTDSLAVGSVLRIGPRTTVLLRVGRR
jgi:isoamylase